MITIKAKSSSGEPYDVAISLEHGHVSAECTCKAGIMHTLCKHRIALLEGDASMLFDPAQAKDLEDVRWWVMQTDLPGLLAELKEADSAVLQAQARVKRLRKAIEKSITGHG